MRRILILSPSTGERSEMLDTIRKGQLADVQFAADVEVDFRPAKIDFHATVDAAAGSAAR
jgi:hypothetical protein